MGNKIWKEIYDLASAGMAVEVNLIPEWQLKREKRPPGRPVNPASMRHWLHYKGNLQTGKRPNCKRTGCSRHLRIDQALWCSEDCELRGMGDLGGILSKLSEQALEELVRTHLDPDFKIIKVEREIKEKKRPRRRRYRYEIPNFRA